MRAIFIGLIAVTALASCQPATQTPLAKAAAQLKPSMNKTNVVTLFSGFNASETDFVREIGGVKTPDPTFVFQTNILQGTKLTYRPKTLGKGTPFECCYVYFDTNGVIVGYQYSRDQ